MAAMGIGVGRRRQARGERHEKRKQKVAADLEHRWW